MSTTENADDGTFEASLEELGFVLQGATRRGGRVWRAGVNRFLELVLHDYHDHVVLTWSFAFGEFADSQGWVAGTGENSFHAIFPRADVRLPPEITAVEAEIRRTLSTLQVDFTAPGL